MRKKVLLILTLLVVFSAISLAQQSKDFFFQKLTTLNGLSSNYIQSIYRDSRGYVWIGTPYGLNRYDGKNIKVYHHDPGNHYSLPCESIFHITEDKTGNLWINSGYGLIEFNPFSEKFYYYQHEAKKPESLGSEYPVPLVDFKNNLWVATDKGLQLFNRRNHTFETFTLSPPDSVKKVPALGRSWALAEDQDHNIWCCGIKGLYKFDNIKRELKLFPFQEKSYGGISDIFIDHEGKFWVVFRKSGINLFHPETGIYEPIPPFKINRFNLFGKTSEWRDPYGVYWLAISTERGLLLYNSKTGEKTIIQNDPHSLFSLNNNEVYYVYTDQENILWIGTKKGLNMLDNADQAFHSILLVQKNSSADNYVKGATETIYEDSDLKMISYSWTKGLGLYDTRWNLIKFYSTIPPSDTSLEARNIVGIYKDFRGIYWITTDNSLVRFDRKKNLFNVFLPPTDIKTHKTDPLLLREITPFDSSSFYIRSVSKGIYKFDFIKEKFEQHLMHNDLDPASLPSNDLRSVLKDDQKNLIIISVRNGIFVYSPYNNRYKIYNYHPDVSIHEALNNLYLDFSLKGNILWLNSAHGLLKFDLLTARFELFNSRNGLANDFLISNEVDNNGNVWVAHNAGISRFDQKSSTFTNFTEHNGLVFQELNHDMMKMTDGNIYIGDNDRLIYFNPNQFKINENIPQVHINSVQVLNKPYFFVTDSLTYHKSLILNYDQDLITVDFSVLNFSHPKDNSFYYRLDNDYAWHKLSEGSVNLVRLSPGQYLLHVTGSNDSGVMNPIGDTLYIRILPPFYRTWWFQGVLVFMVVLIIFEIRRRGIKRIKREEQVKTEFNKQLAQAETKALRAQMNPHFIFNCLNSINSLIIEQKHEIASDYLIKFSKLIRLVLDNSRTEKITIEKELETLKLYVLLESARFDNKFKCLYHIAENVNTNSIMIPPMLLQPFVENAIWHGLMQKESGGTIIVEIKLQNEEFLNISITDDGIGREKAAELKSKSVTHNSHGLKVTSQRIEMMNKLNSTGAHISIIDQKDEQGNATGTKVEFIIPY